MKYAGLWHITEMEMWDKGFWCKLGIGDEGQHTQSRDSGSQHSRPHLGHACLRKAECRNIKLLFFDLVN
jgi:hypothetical protein